LVFYFGTKNMQQNAKTPKYVYPNIRQYVFFSEKQAKHDNTLPTSINLGGTILIPIPIP